MIFCGPAKRVTIRIDANDAASAPGLRSAYRFSLSQGRLLSPGVVP